MADAHETLWKDVQQKAMQEFIEREGEQPLFIVVSGIAPAKGDLVIGEGN